MKLKEASFHSIKHENGFRSANPGALICEKLGGEWSLYMIHKKMKTPSVASATPLLSTAEL